MRAAGIDFFWLCTIVLVLYFEDTANQVIRNRIKMVKYGNLQLGLGATAENVSKLGSKHHLPLDL
jgi:hypothetical protein